MSVDSFEACLSLPIPWGCMGIGTDKSLRRRGCSPFSPSRAVVKARVLGVDAKGRGLKLSLASTKKLADGEKAGAGGAGEGSPIPAAGTFVYGKVRKLITGEVGFFWGRVVWSLGMRYVAGTVSRSRTPVHQYVLPLPQMDGQPAAAAHAKSPHPSILPPHPS